MQGTRIVLGSVTPQNIKQLERFYQVMFPVSYNDKFHKDVLLGGELATLATFADTTVAWRAVGWSLTDSEEILYHDTRLSGTVPKARNRN